MGEIYAFLLKTKKKKKVRQQRRFSVSQLFQIRCGVKYGEFRGGHGLDKDLCAFFFFLNAISR